MKTRIIEVEEPRPGFIGTFMVGLFDEEWNRRSLTAVGYDPATSLLHNLGWVGEHFLVVELGRGHGALFHHKSEPRWDVPETGIYFGPMFLPFMEWLKTQDLSRLDELPEHVVLDGPGSVLRSKEDEGG